MLDINKTERHNHAPTLWGIIDRQSRIIMEKHEEIIRLSERIDWQPERNSGLDAYKVQKIVDLVTQREEARFKKDYVTSDKIRDELVGWGIVIKDKKIC